MDLYNKINGSHYTDPNALEFTTIEDVVYMGMKNDVSFLIDGSMCFIEEQSTPNPNMPARFFSYSGMVYSRRMKVEQGFDLYSLELQSLPDPIFICLCAAPGMKEDRPPKAGFVSATALNCIPASRWSACEHTTP